MAVQKEYLKAGKLVEQLVELKVGLSARSLVDWTVENLVDKMVEMTVTR